MRRGRNLQPTRRGPKSRSEPDVVADCGAYGLVFIEVKYRSGNDRQVFAGKHQKYLDGTDAFADPDLIRRSKLYELARNWRIGVELAGGSPFTLVNLVVKSREPEQVVEFNAGLNQQKGQFLVLTWAELLRRVEAPEWLQRYLDGVF